jgi:hypothetical protein
MSVYIFATQTPYKKSKEGESSKGLLQQSQLNADPVPGKMFCLHCQKNLCDDFKMVLHNQAHARVNIKCDLLPARTFMNIISASGILASTLAGKWVANSPEHWLNFATWHLRVISV